MTLEPCRYGVPRDACTVGCGRACRVARADARVELRRMETQAATCCGECSDCDIPHKPCPTTTGG